MKEAIAKIPAGGWKYKEIFRDNKSIVITGVSKDDLIHNLYQFRLENDIPIGSPQEDVENQSKERIMPQQSRSLRERVTQWKANRMYHQNELVNEDVAEERAKICSTCPFNIMDW